MTNIQLIQAEVCPYAQRTHMCLLEKGLEFEVIEVDLSNKPDWFEKVSPYSKVPVLRVGTLRLYESSIINEYIDEVYPAPALMPSDPGDRAMARTWIDFDNVKFVPAFYRVLLEQDKASRQQLADQLIDHMTFMENLGFAESWQGLTGLGKKLR